MYVLCFVNKYIRSMPCFALLSFMVIIILKKENLSFLQGFQDEKRLTGVLQHTYHIKFQAISANLSVNRCVSALSQWSQQLCEVACVVFATYTRSSVNASSLSAKFN